MSSKNVELLSVNSAYSVGAVVFMDIVFQICSSLGVVESELFQIPRLNLMALYRDHGFL